MKVLQVTHRYPPQIGGVEQQVKGLSERLVANGHDVTVLTADAGGSGSDEVRSGVEIRRHWSLAPGNAVHLAPGLIRSLRRTTADVVHAHNIHSLPLATAVLGTGRPVIATPYYHGRSARSIGNLFWLFYRPLARLALRRSNVVTAVSRWEQETLASHFGIGSEVVPIGIDTACFQSATPIERDRPYLLCVARLEAYKGVQHVIKAMTALPERRLLIAGEGPYREDLERMAREEGVESRVEFLGSVDHDEMPALYAGADVYVSLSQFESYGITVAEALASGTPSVVRNTAALEDWTERADVIGVENVAVSTVANAVTSAARLRAPNEPVPSWDRVVEQYTELYERIRT